jgi:Ala-tRNA(Pro) deacylase
MPARQIKELLDRHGIRYITISHSPAYTAQEIAALAHVPGRHLAKTVIVKVDGDLAMAVLPATRKINFELLREITGSDQVELAHESEFADRFPGCELGAMPPLGNLYGLRVYVAKALAEQDVIAFNAGTHTELVQMRYNDFEQLVAPLVATLSY